MEHTREDGSISPRSPGPSKATFTHDHWCKRTWHTATQHSNKPINKVRVPSPTINLCSHASRVLGRIDQFARRIQVFLKPHIHTSSLMQKNMAHCHTALQQTHKQSEGSIPNNQPYLLTCKQGSREDGSISPRSPGPSKAIFTHDHWCKRTWHTATQRSNKPINKVRVPSPKINLCSHASRDLGRIDQLARGVQVFLLKPHIHTSSLMQRNMAHCHTALQHNHKQS